MKFIYRSVVLAVGCLAITACDYLTSPSCGTVGRYAIHVDVRDAATGDPALDGALLVIRDREYVDSARGQAGDRVLAAGFERPGTYQVQVQKAGYMDWMTSDVKVRRSGKCAALQGVKVTAELQRE